MDFWQLPFCISVSCALYKVKWIASRWGERCTLLRWVFCSESLCCWALTLCCRALLYHFAVEYYCTTLLQDTSSPLCCRALVLCFSALKHSCAWFAKPNSLLNLHSECTDQESFHICSRIRHQFQISSSKHQNLKVLQCIVMVVLIWLAGWGKKQ